MAYSPHGVFQFVTPRASTGLVFADVSKNSVIIYEDINKIVPLQEGGNIFPHRGTYTIRGEFRQMTYDEDFALGTPFYKGAILEWQNTQTVSLHKAFFDSHLYRIVEPPHTVTDMSSLFQSADHVPDITGWDMSNVTDMSNMFRDAWNFNQDISHWDVSNVETMLGTFSYAKSFNQDIGQWDVSKVRDMDGMFIIAASFDNAGQPMPWNTSAVETMREMFVGAISFNRDVSMWDVSNVRIMESMFRHAERFNSGGSTLAFWDTGRVEDMESMFSGARACDQDLRLWNVDKVRRKRWFAEHSLVIPPTSFS